MSKIRFDGEFETRFLNEKSCLEKRFFIPIGASEFGLY